MRVTCAPVKRAKTLAERGLDFVDALVVFQHAKANDREKARLASIFEI